MAGHNHDKHVLVLGCGYSGCVLAQRLAFKGQPVVGTTRSETRASVIRTRGAQPLLFDGTDDGSIDRFRGRVRAVVDMVPTTRRPDGSYEDTLAWLRPRLAEWGLERYVYVSTTGVYGDKQGETVTETTPCSPDSPRTASRRAVEEAVLASGLPAVVVRPSGIYGPGRSQLHRVAAGKYKLVGEGASLTNRVHVTDLAALCEAAVARGEVGATYLASDLEPATQAEVVAHIVSSYGLPEPPRMSVAEARVRLDRSALALLLGSKRIDASATLAALGVTLRYPTYREGLADIWMRERGEIQRLAADRGATPA